MDYYLYKNAWRFIDAPHREQKLQTDQYQQLLKQGGLLVRNTYNYDQQEQSSFWYISKDSFSGFEELTSKCRNKIRRANKNYSYRIIETKTLQEIGYQIFRENLLSYDPNNKSVTKDDFLKFFIDGITECWGCFLSDTETLIGFAINYNWKDACDYELMSILPKYKHNTTYPYYGLIYAMNAYYLQKKHMKYVTDGTRTITEHSQIQDFLIQNFNFRKSYCQLAVYYRWWLKLAVKLLYPFRKSLYLPRVKAILNMEAMQRGEK